MGQNCPNRRANQINSLESLTSNLAEALKSLWKKFHKLLLNQNYFDVTEVEKIPHRQDLEKSRQKAAEAVGGTNARYVQDAKRIRVKLHNLVTY